MVLSHQKYLQTGRDRRDDTGGSGTAHVGAASIYAAPHPSFRTTVPIPGRLSWVCPGSFSGGDMMMAHPRGVSWAWKKHPHDLGRSGSS